MSQPEIKPEDIQYNRDTDLIGKGSYGSVYKGRCRGAEVAVKIPNKQQLTPGELAMFKTEVKFMSNNNHPNIIRLMGACTEVGKLQIVTERCYTDLDNLTHTSDKSKELDLYNVMRMARDAARGMVWLHDQTKTIHRDLKPANLLVDYNYQVKVSDFGFAQVKSDSFIVDKPKGSLVWMAPEVMQSLPFNEKIDVYSFGIILWEIATRKKPFAHFTDKDTFINAICKHHERPPLQTENLPNPLKDLMVRCWSPNPNERCTFNEIVFRLSEIMVDCVIKEPHAALMWKMKYLLPEQELHEQVPWFEFLRAMQADLKVDGQAFNTLRDLLAKEVNNAGKTEYCVTMARFYQISLWFGPFYDPNFGPAITNEMIKLVDAPWFHGDISIDTANSRLSGKPEGTFIVRLSGTNPRSFPFSLSVIGDKHERLERAHGGLLKNVSGHTFRNLFEFVQSNGGELKVPCPKVEDDIGDLRYKRR